jgi:hypothetical protein
MVIVQILAIYGIAFGASQKAAPLVFRLIGLERRLWGAPDLKSQGLARWFFNSLFSCLFCTGFHAGWAGWLVFEHLPPAVTWAFAGAAVSYLLDGVSKRLER